MNLPRRKGQRDEMSSNTLFHSSTPLTSLSGTSDVNSTTSSSFDSRSTQSSVYSNGYYSIVCMFQAEAARRRQKTRKLRRQRHKIAEAGLDDQLKLLMKEMTFG
jgi:hypothetical protein